MAFKVLADTLTPRKMFVSSCYLKSWNGINYAAPDVQNSSQMFFKACQNLSDYRQYVAVVVDVDPNTSENCGMNGPWTAKAGGGGV
jgi:hypothetical protein